MEKSDKIFIKTLVSLAILFIFIFIVSGIFELRPDYVFCKMDVEWNIKNGRTSIKNVSLSDVNEYIRHGAESGDVVEISTALPDVVVPVPSVSLLTRNLPFKAYIDDQFKTSSGMKYTKSNKYLGDINNYISLPENYSGKTLTLQCFIRQNHDYSRIKFAEFGNTKDLTLKFIADNIANIAGGVFLLIFGTIFFIIGSFFISVTPSLNTLMYSSLLIADYGMLLLSHSLILQFFLPLSTADAIQVISMYCQIPFENGAVRSIKKVKINSLDGIILCILDFISLIFIILHFAGIAYINDTEMIYSVVYLFEFVEIIRLHSITKHQNADVEHLELSRLDALLVLDVLVTCIPLFNILTYAGLKTVSNLLIISGPVLYTGFTLYDNFSNLSDLYLNGSEFIKLRSLATKDGLTGLYNRAIADKVMEDLIVHDKDYCIISLDLNNLKTINDNYGHARGDSYIKGFANLLSDTFGEYGTCARTGGDEFLVISDRLTEEKVTGLISSLQQKMNGLSRKDDQKYSVAAGYSFRHDVEKNDPHLVFLKADKLMYDNKRLMKHQEPR